MSSFPWTFIFFKMVVAPPTSHVQNISIGKKPDFCLDIDGVFHATDG
jgi:hypothetical protein